MNKELPRGIIQIYAQEAWHHECFIVGEKIALEALRDAINTALTQNKAEIEVWCSDGEGYVIGIKQVAAGWENQDWIMLPLPYTDDCAKTPAYKMICSPNRFYHKEE